MELVMLNELANSFPRFTLLARQHQLRHVLPPVTDSDIALIEEQLALPLPETYKALLRCARGFWLKGGLIQFGSQHPFVHDFPSFDSLTPQQRELVAFKGGPWPPASQGMLCFAEFFMEADGDQVLFDTAAGLIAGEYPIMYWAHESRPPSVRQLAASFKEFMETFLEYPEFNQDDGE